MTANTRLLYSWFRAFTAACVLETALYPGIKDFLFPYMLTYLSSGPKTGDGEGELVVQTGYFEVLVMTDSDIRINLDVRQFAHLQDQL